MCQVSRRRVVLGGLVLVAAIGCRAAAEPVLFTKGVMVDVKPEDAPAAGEGVEKIEWTACPGEFEPFSLCVYGTDSGAWTIQVDDPKQKGEPGRTIPASAVEVSILWFEQTKGYPPGTTRVKDWVLDVGARGVFLEKGRTQRLWLTVHVPEMAEPGLYEGSFILKEKEGAGLVKVPILLDVLPLKLTPPPRRSVLRDVHRGLHPVRPVQRRQAADGCQGADVLP